jgi:MraZ protein
MAEPYIYSGPGFSLQRDKNRFVLPSIYRSTIRESSGKDVLCVGKSSEWKCLVGFGLSRMQTFEAQLDAEQARADALGKDFNRTKRGMALYSFVQVPFDGSGRFVLPEAQASLANIEDQLFFQGVGPFITIWNPEELYKLEDDPDMEAVAANCRDMAAKELAKAKRK